MPDGMKHKLESRLPGEISITSDMQLTPPLWQKMKRNLKTSWWKWKRRVKTWLKTQHSPSQSPWGTHVNPSLIHVNVWQKPLQYCKVISLQLIKINEKKFNIQKMNIMASGPIIPWQIDRETMETVTDFIFLGSKITVFGDCSHEIKICLLFGRKTMTNVDNILTIRGTTL